MAKKNYKKSYGYKKKYSLEQRLDYHDKKVAKAFSSAKDSSDAFSLFKRKDIAYSTGFSDGVNSCTQFSTIEKAGGDMKAYGAGVKAGSNALDKSRKVKF